METGLKTATTLNHVAFPTSDTAATVRFYTELLDFRLVGAVREDRVPSTGEETPFLHTFFAMQSGECIAFFEIENCAAKQDDGVPRWVRHVAMNVESAAALDQWKHRLIDYGVDVLGVVNHEDIWHSIYFFDPNGVRLEFTHQARPLNDDDATSAKVIVDRWAAEHAVAGPESKNLQ